MGGRGRHPALCVNGLPAGRASVAILLAQQAPNVGRRRKRARSAISRVSGTCARRRRSPKRLLTLAGRGTYDRLRIISRIAGGERNPPQWVVSAARGRPTPSRVFAPVNDADRAHHVRDAVGGVRKDRASRQGAGTVVNVVGHMLYQRQSRMVLSIRRFPPLPLRCSCPRFKCSDLCNRRRLEIGRCPVY